MSIFGPLVAYPLTPRTRDGELAPDALAVLVDRAITGGVDGVTVLGSTGGFAYLDRAARRRVVEVAVEAAAGRVPVMAGIGALTTAEVLELARDAEVAGADALLLPTTAYLPLTGAEVLDLYRTVTATVGRPLWASHNPVTTRFAFTVPMLLEVATLRGIGGVKDRGADVAEVRTRATHLRSGVPSGVEIGFSGDGLGFEALLVGAHTWHSGLAGVLPAAFAAVARAASRGDGEEARALMSQLQPVVDLALGGGGPRTVHAIGEILGLGVGALPAPLHRPDASVVVALEQALDAVTL